MVVASLPAAAEGAEVPQPEQAAAGGVQPVQIDRTRRAVSWWR